ncbi:MAG: hypothetical protein AAF601_12790 [Pseudomonadota bacterium]
MLTFTLAVNIAILVPVIFGLALGNMDDAFGPATDARRILACVYFAIAVLSAVLIALHLGKHSWALPMTLALFAMQIAYKLATVATIGLGSPVVVTNLAVVALQLTVIATLWWHGALSLAG